MIYGHTSLYAANRWLERDKLQNLCFNGHKKLTACASQTKVNQIILEDNSKYKTEYQQPPAITPVSLFSRMLWCCVFLAYFLHIFYSHCQAGYCCQNQLFFLTTQRFSRFNWFTTICISYVPEAISKLQRYYICIKSRITQYYCACWGTELWASFKHIYHMNRAKLFTENSAMTKAVLRGFLRITQKLLWGTYSQHLHW